MVESYPDNSKDKFYKSYLWLLFIITTFGVLFSGLNTWYYNTLFKLVSENPDSDLNITSGAAGTLMVTNGILTICLFVIWVLALVGAIWYTSIASDPVSALEKINLSFTVPSLFSIPTSPTG